jgi:hypothetical protein
VYLKFSLHPFIQMDLKTCFLTFPWLCIWCILLNNPFLLLDSLHSLIAYKLYLGLIFYPLCPFLFLIKLISNQHFNYKCFFPPPQKYFSPNYIFFLLSTKLIYPFAFLASVYKSSTNILSTTYQQQSSLSFFQNLICFL